MAASCHPQQPVSVMDIHGTADPLVPYGGGEVTGRGGSSELISQRQLHTGWALREVDGDGGGQPRKSTTDDGTSVTVTSATGWDRRPAGSSSPPTGKS